MKLRKCILTKNACYKVGRKMNPIGITVHSTGANNPRLSRYVQPDDGELGPNNYGTAWNQDKPGGREVCVHAFIGLLKDGTTVATYQTLPWDMRGWHGGSGPKGSVNNGYIGFEICEDNLNDPVYFSKVYQEAVELCAHLCREYGIKPEKPYLICHSEGHALGMASNHGDVMHWFPKHGKSMDTLRADVKRLLGNPQSQPTVTKPTGTQTENGTYTLHNDVKGYISSAQAISGQNPRTTVKAGTYHIYNQANGSINVTKKPGTPGSWINPKDNKEPKPTYKTYTLLVDVPGHNTAADAMSGSNQTTTVKAGTYAIYKEHNGSLNITKSAGSPGSWINPNLNKVKKPEREQMYRVRKSWEDKSSQKGAFTVLSNAVKLADENPGYKVYDEGGNQVHPKQGRCDTCGQ